MVRFGHRNHQSLGLAAKPAPYMDAPGNLYTSNRNKRKEVDADGDLDELIAQEIQRYEELFDVPHGNRRVHNPVPDDDTLQDGSIYTSSLAPSPASNKDTDDESSRWGLDNPPCSVPSKVVTQTSLLNPHETAAAKACSRNTPTKDSSTSSNNKKTFVPPVPVLPVDQQPQQQPKDPPGKKKTQGSSSNKDKDNSKTKNKVPSTPPLASKKTKKPSFPRRLLFGGPSNAHKNNSSNNGPPLPSTPSTLPTPRTQASPKGNGPKIKFFAPGKKFFLHNATNPSSSNNNNNNNKGGATRISQPRNLVMAAAFVHPKSVKRAASPSPPELTPAAAPPKSPPSPPPPIDHCVIRCGDGASVISTQSSLTEALDVWLVHNTPPKIIGGSGSHHHSHHHNHHNQKISPLMLEAYEGRLIPYTAQAGEDVVDEEASAASPGALLLTEEGLYFHNHHGKSLSPVRIVPSSSDLTPAEVIQDNLVAMVWADKEQRELLKESKQLAQADVVPEDADMMQVVKVLGLEDHHRDHPDQHNQEEQSPPRVDASLNVKRNLFGTVTRDDELTQLDVSLAPLQHVMSAADEEEEDDAADEVVAMDDNNNDEDERVALALQHVEYHPESFQPPKPSKFKRFLSKLVTNPKVKQLQQEAQVQRLLEQERARAKEAQLERQRMEREETKRIQQKRLKELERQRKLELGSHGEPQSHTSDTGVSTSTGSLDVDPIRPRSFSLLSGEMKPDPQQNGSQSSYTAEITSFPTANTAPSSSPSLLESPCKTIPSDVSPAYSSPLVNFQFHRREGVKLFTMAYAVDTSEREGMKWKDVVNRAWKQDRKLVKSGVFSGIELERIIMIRHGQLEMRFELPYWGKHASRSLGPKTLDLLLDVVGPQRPVMVAITIEEPHLAVGVDEEEAMAALF
ncbi:expressed unknown protein [Seminavis robusta]|uniref:Uncharacterized protein n=1 Tax=Seminavis robusta TaxID=568900 RepID=A0A9N8HVB1_9STRA|nr:expressed unknown protein [Seminavis robusta]|eukprot:Sro1772_g296680.1 n/a (907) ;mRNA; f:5898-8618